MTLTSLLIMIPLLTSPARMLLYLSNPDSLPPLLLPSIADILPAYTARKMQIHAVETVSPMTVNIRKEMAKACLPPGIYP